MTKLAILFEALLLLVLASVLALFGAGIPVHFRAVAPGVLVEAGRGTESLDELATLYLDSGKIGPVEIIRSIPKIRVDRASFEERQRFLLERRPAYALSGGPAPYFEQFLSMLAVDPKSLPANEVMSLLIRSEYRRHLLGFLENSSNAAVHTLLETRRLTAYTRFMPVATPAGQPLDAAILTTALLVQGSHLSPEVLREIKFMAERTIAQDRLALERLEEFYLTVLSLARRLNWVQLSELLKRFSSVETLNLTASFLRRNPEAMPMIYGLVLLSNQPGAVVNYARDFGEEVWDDLSFALSAGKGAVDALLKHSKPVYRPPAFVEALDRITAWVHQAPLLSFTHHHPQAAINLKILAILAAGYAVALFLSNILEIIMGRRKISRLHPLVITRNSIVALFFATTLWVLMEPALFASGPEPKARLRLIFNIASNLESLKSQNLDTAMLDQITIIIIILFFLLQMIVYVFCLIQISEIKKQEATFDLKLKLLENEDNLFDLGLYVGLGGTVASLILLAMDIVQASLIAAYSSTLFGILFVAVLKVVHVRPYRRLIIVSIDTLQNESGATPDNC